jgi:hypothetical protein
MCGECAHPNPNQVQQLPDGARALALDAAGGLVLVTVLSGEMPQVVYCTAHAACACAWCVCVCVLMRAMHRLQCIRMVPVRRCS